MRLASPAKTHGRLLPVLPEVDDPCGGWPPRPQWLLGRRAGQWQRGCPLRTLSGDIQKYFPLSFSTEVQSCIEWK